MSLSIEVLRALLGLPPEALPPGAAEALWTQPLPDHPDLVLRASSLEAPDGPIPVWCLRPNDARPRPLMLYAHAHGGRFEIGKNELIAGRPSLQSPPLGIALAEAGYHVVCWDARSFGERRSMLQGSWTKAALWQGRAPWGLMLGDAERVLAWALAQDDVDPARAGVIGLSMGALLALWLAAIDRRLRVCVELCCLANIRDLMASGDHDRHAPYFMVPGWLEHGDSLELCRMIAPRPHLVCAGARDLLTPATLLATIDRAMTELYATTIHSDHWRMLVDTKTGHQETPEHRAAVLGFLQQFLAVQR